MNLLTFDIEEWALALAGGYGTAKRYAEYDAFLDKVLSILDARNVKATFFCTGMMAQSFPHVVKMIQRCGHEIGCHSNSHMWMNKMTRQEAYEDTRAAVCALEQCVGQKIVSYRAPAFSIGENNKWMIEVLVENGIESDSSVYPAARDFGGFPAFPLRYPCLVHYGGVFLKEFPISVTRILGKKMAYSGGGYFRLLPLSFIRGCMEKTDYTMCYFHINDLLPEKGGIPSKEKYESYYKEVGSLKNRYIRYIKSNIGKNNAWNKLVKLINSEEFISIEQFCSTADWSKAEIVNV